MSSSSARDLATAAGAAHEAVRPERTLAEQVRDIAREHEFMAYSSAGNPKNPNASRHHALRAGVLHLAADALSDASCASTTGGSTPSGTDHTPPDLGPARV